MASESLVLEDALHVEDVITLMGRQGTYRIEFRIKCSDFLRALHIEPTESTRAIFDMAFQHRDHIKSACRAAWAEVKMHGDTMIEVEPRHFPAIRG